MYTSSKKKREFVYNMAPTKRIDPGVSLLLPPSGPVFTIRLLSPIIPHTVRILTAVIQQPSHATPLFTIRHLTPIIPHSVRILTAIQPCHSPATRSHQSHLSPKTVSEELEPHRRVRIHPCRTAHGQMPRSPVLPDPFPIDRTDSHWEARVCPDSQARARLSWVVLFALLLWALTQLEGFLASCSL